MSSHNVSFENVAGEDLAVHPEGSFEKNDWVMADDVKDVECSESENETGADQWMCEQKAWQKKVPEELRTHLVERLLETVSPGEFAAKFLPTNGEWETDLTQWAINVEEELFEKADHRDEYYFLVSKKIHEVEIELREKTYEWLNEEQQRSFHLTEQKSWQKEVSAVLREHLAEKLLTAVYPGVITVGVTPNDYRFTNFFEWSKKTENEIFEKADNTEQYYNLLVEKIYRVVEKLQTKTAQWLLTEREYKFESCAESGCTPQGFFQNEVLASDDRDITSPEGERLEEGQKFENVFEQKERENEELRRTIERIKRDNAQVQISLNQQIETLKAQKKALEEKIEQIMNE